jgi:hypothetical protein
MAEKKRFKCANCNGRTEAGADAARNTPNAAGSP